MVRGIFTINAKRWHNQGNTYHSVEVFRDNKFVGKNAFEYGYGEQYKVTAHKLMQNAGIFKAKGKRLASGMDDDYYNFTMLQRKHPTKFLWNVNDVRRRKDL